MVARNVVVNYTCARQTRSDPGSIPGTAKSETSKAGSSPDIEGHCFFFLDPY